MAQTAKNIASLVLIVRDGHILLGEKKQAEIGTGTLNGPGGKLEPKDRGSLIACALRETWEELDIWLDPNALSLAAIVTFHAAGTPDFKVHVYVTGTFVGTPKETEHMFAPAWYPISDLPFARMLESDAAWLPRVLSGERFRANVYYHSRAKDFDRIEFLPFS